MTGGVPLPSSAAAAANTPSTETTTQTPQTPEPNDAAVLHVVFLIDITGSMGGQIEGVKAMVSSFCAVPRQGIQLHIHTFTETAKGCYVSATPPTMSQSEVVDYVRLRLKLSCPPDAPTVSAHGGDGPENVAAGPVIVFLITDADPHYKSHGQSQEALREREWLTENGFSEDIFEVLNSTVESLNVTFVPILYGAPNLTWYMQAATLTNGIILFPQTSASQVLATGLGALLGSLQARITGGEAVSQGTLDALRGFRVVLLEQDDFSPLDSDPGRLSDTRDIYKRSDDLAAAIGTLLETSADRFEGKRATRRVRGTNPAALAASIKFFVVAMMEALGRTDLLGDDGMTATEARDSLRRFEGSTPPVYLPSTLSAPKPPLTDAEKVVAAGESAIRCNVLLDTVLGTITALEALPTKNEEDLSKWLSIAMELMMVRFVDVRFPRDKLDPTRVDFADAWSTHVRDISTASVVSALAAVSMRVDGDREGHIRYKDPMSGREYSTALIMAHPRDAVLTRAFEVLTGLPELMGVVQGNLVSGGYRVFPSLSPGLLASTLVQMCFNVAKRTDAGGPTEAEWDVMRSLVWSLQRQAGTPAAEVVQSLKEGKGFNNPADGIPKLVAGLITYWHRFGSAGLTTSEGGPRGSTAADLSRELFEEMTAGRVAAIHNTNNRRKAAGQDPVYPDWVDPSEIARCFVSTNVGGTWDFSSFDPLAQLHPCEAFANPRLKSGGEEAAPPDGAGETAGWESRLAERVADTALFRTTFAAHELLTRIVFGADLSQADPARAIPAPAAIVGLLDASSARRIMAESALLARRPARFEPVVAEDRGAAVTSAPVWRRREAAELGFVAMGRAMVGECIAGESRGWWERRNAHARERLLELAAARAISPLVEAGTALTSDGKAAFLRALREDVKLVQLGKQYQLSRMDVPDLLALVPASHLPTLGRLIVVGDWTSMQPPAIRRHAGKLKALFEGLDCADEVLTAVTGRMVCCRVGVPNRHGHTAELQWPGLLGWTEEYEEARLKNKDNDRIRDILAYMRRCTEAGVELPR
ncbi:hypothetical protein DFJ73DRAFT_772182 [Zopfochytrium polystomum]|nr:hypothetical protein DFJ73DRAFT_772182 [Zopfochytrium polystomum]